MPQNIRRQFALKRAAVILPSAESAPPIDVEAIAKALQISVTYEPTEPDLAGFLIAGNANKGKTIIGINGALPKLRQRFSLAHMIGHFMMHNTVPLRVDKTKDQGLFDQSTDLVTEEVEANLFAIELLLPRDWLNSEIEGSLIDAEDATIHRLAKRYQVTASMLLAQIFHLRCFP